MLDRGHDPCEARPIPAPVDLERNQTQNEPQDAAVPLDLDPVSEASMNGPDNHRRNDDLADSFLLIYADILEDIEGARMAAWSRRCALKRDKGLEDSPEAKQLTKLVEALVDAEHTATLNLQRAIRNHPLGAWVKRNVGIGEKQGARMLAALGNPAERPNVGKLWQYAGHGDPERSRKRKGERCAYNPNAKVRTHLCAESCIKHAHSPYRPVYDAARASWADRETSDGHKHNHALRLVGKAILKDLWVEARAVKEGGS